jgi:hypothetical protein
MISTAADHSMDKVPHLIGGDGGGATSQDRRNARVIKTFVRGGQRLFLHAHTRAHARERLVLLPGLADWLQQRLCEGMSVSPG